MIFKPFISDSHCEEESSPSVKAPNLLLEGGGGDASVLVKEGCNECIQQTMSGGSGDMLKLFGVWEGMRELKAYVSCSFEMWSSRDSISAIKLSLPRMCWLYNAALLSINVVANHLATVSWTCWHLINDALYSHPKELELLVKASIFVLPLAERTVKWMVMTEAINLSKLMDNFPFNSFGNFYRHASPLQL